MEPLAVITTIGVFGVVVKAIVDGARRQYPKLDGLAVQALALALGVGAVWAFDLRGAEALLDFAGATVRTPHFIADYVITGAAVAAGSGFLAEIAGRSGNTPVVVEVDAEGRHL